VQREHPKIRVEYGWGQEPTAQRLASSCMPRGSLSWSPRFSNAYKIFSFTIFIQMWVISHCQYSYKVPAYDYGSIIHNVQCDNWA